MDKNLTNMQSLWTYLQVHMSAHLFSTCNLMANQPTPPNVPPQKYGLNKAFLRETNGEQTLYKALLLGGGTLGGWLTSHDNKHVNINKAAI